MAFEVNPKTLNFTQPGLFGLAAQSETSMSSFQHDAFQPFVFQTIPDLLKADTDWTVAAKKRKWTVVS